MYAFSNSLLEPVGEYRVEVYNMKIFDYDASVNVELKVFGEKENESYVAEYEITRADEKTASGACINRPTKEDTFTAVELAVIRVLEDKNQYWE